MSHDCCEHDHEHEHDEECGCGEVSAWDIDFHPGSGRLDLTHGPSSARVNGVLRFEAMVGGESELWRIDVPRDGVPARLALLDRGENVQGYLMFKGAGDRLQILVLHRAAQSYRGRLSFEGVATLGDSTFACRTAAPRDSRVVQMASGPADSALNDSLFDVDADTLLRFGADEASIATAPDAGGLTPFFRLRLCARPEQAAGSTLVFDVDENYYRGRYVPHYSPIDRRRCPSPPTGWMSWNVYFDTAGEKENLDEARVAAEHLRPFGLEIWSIESWQANSDKLPVRTFHNLDLSAHPGQFPHGMKWLAEQIRALGFRPGIWVPPFGTGNEEFYEAHKSWFLHDEDGAPMSNWCGLYLVDPSQPEVRQHLRDMLAHMAREWGYEFFKIDGMSGRHASYSAHFYERCEVADAFRDPCEDPFELCVAAFREGIGDNAVLLACQGHYTGPETAYADAARIGGDIVAPDQPSQWHNILSQTNATLNQLFVHNIVWYGDPDTLLVGDFHTLDVARITTTVVALPGQMMFAGDKLAELSEERMRLLQQALPVCDVRPLDLFPIFELRPIWDLKISRPFAAWDVVALFNWTDEESRVEFTFAELGLPDHDAYLLYEFWGQEFLGLRETGAAVDLAPRSTKLLAIHRAAERPQLLSTDRHVTQGGTCLKDLAWDDGAGVLRGATALVANHVVTLAFFVPDGCEFESAQAEGGVVAEAGMREDRVLRLTLKHHEPVVANWRIAFGGACVR